MTARLDTNSQPLARGMIFIHSASAALCPHIEWALGAVVGSRLSFEWQRQPAERGAQRAEASWTGPVGTGAAFASALTKMGHTRFEITEEPTRASQGQRFCFTPSLGAFSSVIGVHGDILVPEDRLKHAMEADAVGGEPLQVALGQLLGVPWDEELDVFRYASEDAPIRWLHQVV